MSTFEGQGHIVRSEQSQIPSSSNVAVISAGALSMKRSLCNAVRTSPLSVGLKARCDGLRGTGVLTAVFIVGLVTR